MWAEIPTDLVLNACANQQQLAVHATKRGTGACQRRKARHVVCRPHRIGEPGQLGGRELSGKREHALRQVHLIAMACDQARELTCGVCADSGVVVHMQQPNAFVGLTLCAAQLLSELKGPRLVRGRRWRAVGTRDDNDPYLIALQVRQRVFGFAAFVRGDA